MKLVTVVPEHGYGWQQDSHSIEMPPPFSVAVRRYEEADTKNAYKLITGRILDLSHALSGLWVLISLRTAGAEPTYNVFCYKVEPPFMDSGDIDPLCVPIAANGFAMLKL
jgi:hypothetical protein